MVVYKRTSPEPSLVFSQRLSVALAFLHRDDLLELPVGKIELDGEKVYVSIQEYDTQPAQELRYETHDRYYDVQYVAAGQECILVADRSDLTEVVPYDRQRDLTLYEDHNVYSRIFLRGGDYVILSPNEAHKPKCMCQAPEYVRKVVIKILAEE